MQLIYKNSTFKAYCIRLTGTHLNSFVPLLPGGPRDPGGPAGPEPPSFPTGTFI